MASNRASFPIGINAILLIVMFTALLIAGGASRADVLAQPVIRGVSWLVLAAMILFAPAPNLRPFRTVLLLLTAALLLILLQLIPLPPGLWAVLPGRSSFVQAAILSGEMQPWRPLAIAPDAAVNAASSLVVPFAILLIVAGLQDRERTWLPGAVLLLVAISTMLGLLQFSGMGFANPLLNYSTGDVTGAFANRNHFALFVAIGCLIAPVWAFQSSRRAPGWRAPAALGLVLLFVLIILASGSRAGMLVGLIAIGLGLTMAQRGIRRVLGRAPGWVFPAIIGGIILTIAIFVMLSIATNRAISIERILSADSEDMRTRALPTVLSMIGLYFPAGSGFGGFDPVFRIHEPFALLKPTYFNHAHNDFLEIILEGGLPALLLLIAALVWWGWATMRVWRGGGDGSNLTPRLGSAILLLVLMASALDYPARTPMMMAVIVIAAMWLAAGVRSTSSSALPKQDHHL